MSSLRIPLLASFLCLAWPALAPVRGEDAKPARQLQSLDPNVLPKDARGPRKLYDDMRALRWAANDRETKAWHTISGKDDWERYRDKRLRALERSLGTFPPPPRDLKARVTRTLEGDGYRIDNVVFQSRPGLVVTANLYRPEKPGKAMPGILICHSHHNPKTQGELQDMGILWARRGCVVLVMDQVGHGERRQHPFPTAASYPREFRVSRQDYYFRYNVGIHLHTIGDSLIGWMVYDLRRGVDLLLSRPGVDPKKILLLGAVAAGGDPTAVTAALDRRIAAAVPFNFGGPQPETRFPLPPDAEASFNFAGGGSWESTRNLRLSARDGFLPWVIVAGIAPRRLIYAHEFSWDKDHDPVWTRLQKVYGFYDARDHLASVHGSGAVTGRGSGNTHCNNIGATHRQRGIYAAFQRWFDIPIPKEEVRERHPTEKLLCLTPEARKEFKPRAVHEIAAELGKERARAARAARAKLDPEKRREALRKAWRDLLGVVDVPKGVKAEVTAKDRAGSILIERAVLTVGGVPVPLLILIPLHEKGTRLPAVVAVAHGGKQQFLRQRSQELAALLEKGVVVALPDVRGTGETSLGTSRRRQSSATGLSSSELMLGRTLLGLQLRDLRAVLSHLKSHPTVDGKRLALWGDSFAPTHPAGAKLAVPLGVDEVPTPSEPLGGLLALLGALFEDEVRAVYVHGGLTGYQSLLQSPFVYVPHDVIVPGVLTTGDLCDVAGALAPRAVRLEGLVDGLNRRASAAEVDEALRPARAGYREAKADGKLQIARDGAPDGEDVTWLVKVLK